MNTDCSAKNRFIASHTICANRILSGGFIRKQRRRTCLATALYILYRYILTEHLNNEKLEILLYLIIVLNEISYSCNVLVLIIFV